MTRVALKQLAFLGQQYIVVDTFFMMVQQTWVDEILVTYKTWIQRLFLGCSVGQFSKGQTFFTIIWILFQWCAYAQLRNIVLL